MFQLYRTPSMIRKLYFKQNNNIWYDAMDNFGYSPSRNEVIIFTILSKQIDKRAVENIISVLKWVLIILIMSLFSEKFFKNLSGLLHGLYHLYDHQKV